METHDASPPAKDERMVKLKASCTEVVDVITVEPGMADVVCQGHSGDQTGVKIPEVVISVDFGSHH
ncbi:hypothetical protein HT118_01265 [Escherichia coli]|nr:hypothetical protein [Escherichia coli]